MDINETGHTLPEKTILDDRYEVIRKLGEGGMGEVYLALDKRTSREVAIKILRTALANDDSDKKRFIQESIICAKIKHENVVQVIDAFFYDSFPCFAMEYVDGHSLKTLFDQKQGWKTTVPVIIDTLGAIHAAHKLGIIHRDLKPSNIFISRNGKVKVGDWGIAKITDDGPAMTKTGMILGTPHYLAPERIVDGTSFPQSDIYAIGCILHEAVCGSPPFTGELSVIVNSQIFKLPEIAENTPDILKTFILSLLVKEVSKRPSDALKVKGELSSIYKKLISESLGKNNLSSNVTKHNIPDSKSAETEKLYKGSSGKSKTTDMSTILPSPSTDKITDKSTDKSSLKRLCFALLLVVVCGSILYSTVLKDRAVKIPTGSFLSRAYAIDFQTLELRYDSRLKGEFEFTMFEVTGSSIMGTRSSRPQNQPCFMSGMLDFSKPIISSGRTNNIRISLPSPYYRDISLHIKVDPCKIFEISMKPVFMEAFKPLITIQNESIESLSQELSLLRGIKSKSKEPFLEALRVKGLSRTVLNQLELLIPRYLTYINYSTNLYSEDVEVLTTLRKLSPFLVQEDVHPVLGLTSREMGFQYWPAAIFPKAPGWTIMSRKKFNIERGDNLLHYPFIVNKLDELKENKALFKKTAESGLIMSVAIRDDHSLHEDDLMSHYETELLSERDLLLKGEWPPTRARLDIIFTVYDVNNYFSIAINGNKPISFYKTWSFAPRIGQRVCASALVPVSWLKQDKNYIDIVPAELTNDGKIEILQTLLIKSQLRVQFDK